MKIKKGKIVGGCFQLIAVSFANVFLTSIMDIALSHKAFPAALDFGQLVANLIADERGVAGTGGGTNGTYCSVNHTRFGYSWHLHPTCDTVPYAQSTAD